MEKILESKRMCKAALFASVVPNYKKILGDINSFWFFVFGLLLLILSYWLWSEFKDKLKNKVLLFSSSIIIFILSIFIINSSWSKMISLGDDDFLNSLIYTFYYSFLTITSEVGFGLIIAFALYQKLKGKQFFQMILLLPYITPSVMGAAGLVIVTRNPKIELRHCPFFQNQDIVLL